MRNAHSYPRLPRLALLLATGLAVCSKAEANRQPPGVPVRVAVAARIDAPITMSASGIVQPLQTVAVTPQVTGTLLDVAFREGDFVAQGQLLFHIDPRPLQTAVDQSRAALARDEAQLAAAQHDDERYQTLAGKGYVTQSQADQVHATALAEAATVNADRAALRGAEINLEHAAVRAPIAGRTGSLLVKPGNNVSPSSGALVVINQIRPVLVRFPVPEQQFDAVQRAVATHPLMVTAAPKDSVEPAERGTLSFLDNAIDSLTGTVTGKANFPNNASRLWPGELVFLDVQLNVLRNVLAVPTTAIVLGQDSSFVYVVDAKDVASQRTVTMGPEVAGMTIIENGLRDGEEVVVDGQSRLNQGTHVTIIRSSGDTVRTRALARSTK